MDTYSDGLGGKVAVLHHAVAALIQVIDDILVSCHLGLKSLVLLDLGRQVGQLLPRLFAGRLQLLLNPRLQLIWVRERLYCTYLQIVRDADRQRCN